MPLAQSYYAMVNKIIKKLEVWVLQFVLLPGDIQNLEPLSSLADEDILSLRLLVWIAKRGLYSVS